MDGVVREIGGHSVVGGSSDEAELLRDIDGDGMLWVSDVRVTDASLWRLKNSLGVCSSIPDLVNLGTFKSKWCFGSFPSDGRGLGGRDGEGDRDDPVCPFRSGTTFSPLAVRSAMSSIA